MLVLFVVGVLLSLLSLRCVAHAKRTRSRAVIVQSLIVYAIGMGLIIVAMDAVISAVARPDPVALPRSEPTLLVPAATHVAAASFSH